jgi:uncharacterized protein YbbC (DUF1343 family)
LFRADLAERCCYTPRKREAATKNHLARVTLLVASGSLTCLAGCSHESLAIDPEVRPGIEVLVTDSLHLLEGRRVGLVTNQTGVDREGIGDVDILVAVGVELVAIFSPEHGFRGELNEEDIGHSTDSATGLPIYSLYGTRRDPKPEMLETLDVLLIDMQDIGARPYTYISTALLAMRVAAEVGRDVFVLDRPDPVGGELVQGPLRDPAFDSFVGMLPVPLRHGMTFGELALLGNEVLGIRARVTVIPVDGWRRPMWYDETGIPWVKPSPNMPDLESATHYPGTVIFEGTNLSVGRGTPIAFQVLGAPWLRPQEVMVEVGPFPGITVSDTSVTPRSPADGKYPDLTVPALKFAVTDRESYDPTRLAVLVLAALRDVHPDSFAFTGSFDRLAGSDQIRLAIEAGRPAAEIVAAWEGPLEEFGELRERFLIYR